MKRFLLVVIVLLEFNCCGLPASENNNPKVEQAPAIKDIRNWDKLFSEIPLVELADSFDEKMVNDTIEFFRLYVARQNAPDIILKAFRINHMIRFERKVFKQDYTPADSYQHPIEYIDTLFEIPVSRFEELKTDFEKFKIEDFRTLFYGKSTLDQGNQYDLHVMKKYPMTGVYWWRTLNHRLSKGNRKVAEWFSETGLLEQANEPIF